MSCLNKSHRELTDGVGSCSVPMWSNGCPAGFCNEPAYGQYIDGQRFAEGPIRGERMDGKYSGYVPSLACYGHGGPEHLVEKKDE